MADRTTEREDQGYRTTRVAWKRRSSLTFVMKDTTSRRGDPVDEGDVRQEGTSGKYKNGSGDPGKVSEGLGVRGGDSYRRRISIGVSKGVLGRQEKKGETLLGSFQVRIEQPETGSGPRAEAEVDRGPCKNSQASVPT